MRVPNAENLKVFAEKGLVFVSLKFANPYANPRKVIDANWLAFSINFFQNLVSFL